MPWLALQLEVEAPLAEALSDALLELGALSVTIEDADAATAAESPRYAEPGSPEPPGWQRNRISAIVDLHTDASAMIGAAASAAGLRPEPAYRVSAMDDDDWVRRTQSQFAPLRVGKRLWIVPSWCAPPIDQDAVVVRLDPGLAFGTGTHPTTQLVLEWLEQAISAQAAACPGRALRVLDYGCGSGILGLAAARLGAAEVVAVDLDPHALDACAENARNNGVAIRVVAPQALPPGQYDLMVANILSRPLIDLAPLFAERARPGARIALSGVLAEQATQVLLAYAAAFDVRIERQIDGWVLVAGERR